MKEKIRIKDILEKTNGKLITGDENAVIERIERDTRQIQKGDMYIGLIGSKNGGEFFDIALDNGAMGAIIQDVEITEEQILKYKDKVIIKVDDTLKALQEIAKIKRNMYDIPVVAITGSVGKTSTKDIVASVLSQKYKTLKTEGNYNNHIGVPLTLLNLRDEEVAVVEMGMNHLGEISVLSNIALPTMCIITNVGTSHIGNLGSRENILKAKLEILDGNKEKDLIINNDNDMLNKFNKENKDVNITTYGIEEDSKIYATDIVEKEEYSEFTCNIEDEKFKVRVPVAGRHFIYNALCAATVGHKLGLSNQQIKNGIENFELTKKRMDIEVLDNGVKIINDSYNASFESMKGSLQNLGRYETRKIAVLGDMFELGSYSEELHRKVGKEVVENKIDILMCTGENSKYIVEEAKNNGMQEAYYFENKQQLVENLKNILRKDDVVLLKASNGMKFFEILETLKK